MRYGSREIMDVVLKDVRTGEPKAYFESLTASSLEFAGASVYARGGKGHPKLIGWDSEKDVTMNFEDSLITKASLGILTGSQFGAASSKPIHKKEVLKVETSGSDKVINLSKAPLASKKSFFYKTTDGTDLTLKLNPTVTDGVKKVVVSGLVDGDQVIADYYFSAPTGTQSMTIASDIFPGVYMLEGTTLWRNEEGVDVEAIYTIPKLKIQPNFTINMASTGDPQPFAFVGDVLKDTKSTAMVVIDLLEEPVPN